MKYLQGLLVLQGLRIRYCVMVSMRNNQSNGAVECIRCDVPVCIAAGFSPENLYKIHHSKTFQIKGDDKYT